MDHPFRSAALGGFNKQDVLSFLEEQAKQSAKAQQTLQGRLEAAERQSETLRQEGEELRQQLEEARREVETARQSRDSLHVQLEQVNQELSASREQLSQAAKELEQARRERDEARSQLEELRPDAQAYVQLKERTAGVELEAHRRAQAIQEKAESDAQRTRRQVNQWFQRLGREYDTLRSQVEATVSHAASELEKAGERLDQVSRLMGDQETVLEGLARAYGETDLDRVEAPMPIPEEE